MDFLKSHQCHGAHDAQDAITVMKVHRVYGGLTFFTAYKVLIRDFSQIYSDWTRLAKVDFLIPVACVLSVYQIKPINAIYVLMLQKYSASCEIL